MDGAGIMNLPTQVGGSNTQDGLDSFAPLIAAQQAARDMGYPRFTRELLSAGAEMDQAEVDEFLQTIRNAGLTSEDVALMRRVVEAVFNDPNNYPEVRQTLLQEGIPEDLLPETFDLEFFTALRMAVEEAENLAREPRPTEQEMPMGMMEGAPIEMAEGGIVGLPQLKPIARAMASMGRQGDTMLAHITPQEAMMLKRMGGSGSINPYTGLPEFFIKKIFKGISKGIKSIAKGVKKFAKSTVGRIVLSVALGAFLGPMATGFLQGSMGITLSAAAATGISAGVGVFGSSLLAGDGLKNSLRNGLMAGAMTYGTAGLMGDFSTPAGGPQSVSEGFQQGVQNIKKPFETAYDFVKGDAAATPPPAATPPADVGVGTAQELVAQQPPASGIGPQPGGFGDFTQAATPTAPVDINVQQGLPPGLPQPSTITGVDLNAPLQPPAGPLDRLTQGARDIYSEYISPSRASIQPPSISEAIQRVQADAAAGGITLKPETVYAEAQKIVAKETPGFVAKYAPLALTTTAGADLLTGGKISEGLGSMMKSPEMPIVAMTPEKRAEIQAALRTKSPEFFGSFLPAPPQTYNAARGSGPQGVEDFPRKNGHISGPGTGTSDDIPAMLSDGEFVFTAQAVRNMGGGSRRKGAAKMYKLMKMLEGGPVGKTAKA